MKDGVCPKCGSRNIYTNAGIDDKVKYPSLGHVVIIKPGILSYTYAAFDDYACIDCGYVESYVMDWEKLREIQANWRRVGEENPKRKNYET